MASTIAFSAAVSQVGRTSVYSTESAGGCARSLGEESCLGLTLCAGHRLEEQCASQCSRHRPKSTRDQGGRKGDRV